MATNLETAELFDTASDPHRKPALVFGKQGGSGIGSGIIVLNVRYTVGHGKSERVEYDILVVATKDGEVLLNEHAGLFAEDRMYAVHKEANYRNGYFLSVVWRGKTFTSSNSPLPGQYQVNDLRLLCRFIVGEVDGATLLNAAVQQKKRL